MHIEQSRALMICYNFPPVGTIGSVRNYQIARQFEASSQGLFIITTKNYRYLPQETFFNLSGLNIHPVFTADYRTILAHLPAKKKLLSGNVGKNPFLHFLLKLKDSFPFNLFLDEGNIGYVFAAVRKAEQLIKAHNIQAIYSSFRPNADHLVAWLLKGRHPHLHWIADYRDAHVDLNRNNVCLPGLQHWFNRRIIARADTVTTVSEGVASYLQRYGKSVYVLRNGINPDIRPTAPPARNEKFRITYTGSIYADKQHPQLLFGPLSALLSNGQIPKEKIELIYAGKDQMAWENWIRQFGLQACSKVVGKVSMQEAIQLQQSSQLNLLMSWSGPYIQGILTGKIYEYLAARRPILALINGSFDPEFESIFRQTHAGLIVYPGEETRANDYLLKLYKQWESNGDICWEFNEEGLSLLNWDHQMDQFFNFLSQDPAQRKTPMATAREQL